jgi:hypothetical protein
MLFEHPTVASLAERIDTLLWVTKNRVAELRERDRIEL